MKRFPEPRYSREVGYHAYDRDPALYITDDFGTSFHLPPKSEALDQWAWRTVQDTAWRCFGNCI